MRGLAGRAGGERGLWTQSLSSSWVGGTGGQGALFCHVGSEELPALCSRRAEAPPIPGQSAREGGLGSIGGKETEREGA